MRFILLIALLILSLNGEGQTICAYESEGNMYIVTYSRTLTSWMEPNPSDGQLVLSIGNYEPGDELTVTIYNALQKISYSIIGKETPLDCSALPGGMYHYAIASKGSIVSGGKFIIQK